MHCMHCTYMFYCTTTCLVDLQGGSILSPIESSDHGMGFVRWWLHYGILLLAIIIQTMWNREATIIACSYSHRLHVEIVGYCI